MRRAFVFAAALPLLLSACTEIYGVGGDRFEGRWDYDGWVDRAFDEYVTGSLRITRASRGRAYVDIDWHWRDDGFTVLRIRSETRAVADIVGDWIEFEFYGDYWTGSRWVPFRLYHEGRLRGRRIDGQWWLDMQGYADEQGDFTARR